MYPLSTGYALKVGSKAYNTLLKCEHIDDKVSAKIFLRKMYMDYRKDPATDMYPILIEEEGHSIIIQQRPQHLDSLIYDFLTDKAKDFEIYEDYIANLDWMLTIKSLYKKEKDLAEDKSIKLLKARYININYGYNLGINIDRCKFRDYVNKSKDFSPEYRKSGDTAVTVYLPLDLTPELSDEILRNEKNQKIAHKFIVYKTGGITQSGPHPIANEQAYYKFMDLIIPGLNEFGV